MIIMKLSLIVSLVAAVVSRHTASAYPFSACNFSSVFTDPWVGGCGGAQLFLASPSEVSACTSSMNLDPDNATQFIDSLTQLARDFYVFTDVGIDPPKSDPNVTLFDYPIYQGEGGGQVDLVAEMNALKQQIIATGSATVDLFWKVNEIFGKFNDAHMTIGAGMYTGGLLDDFSVYLQSDEVRTGAAVSVEMDVLFPSEEGFVITATINGTDGSTTSKRIVEIDGMAPIEFFTAHSTSAPFYHPYKSLGPRVSALISDMTQYKNNPYFAFGYLKACFSCDGVRNIYVAPEMSRFVKDHYNVKYDDASTTTWHTLQVVPCTVQNNYTKAEIEAALTQPGDLYSSFATALGIATSRRKLVGTKEEAIKKKTNDDTPRRRLIGEGSVIEMFGANIGFTFFDDYAVLKVDSFSIAYSDVVAAWKALTDAAAARGITKLLVDVIHNGGGDPAAGYLLASYMYPDAAWDDLSNPYDQVYSDAIDRYWNIANPIINQVADVASEVQAEVILNLTNFLNQDPVVLVQKLTKTLNAYTALGIVTDGSSDAQAAYYTTDLILNVTQSRSPNAILPAEVFLLLQQVAVINSGSSQPGKINSNYFAMTGSQPVPRELERGGKKGNYTAAFDVLSPNFFSEYRNYNLGMANRKQFKQYIILADGNGVGSTTNTWQSTVNEYAKKNVGSVSPAQMVSFGGTGMKEDSAVTQFAGGFVGGASVTDMYTPAILLLVFANMMDGTELGNQVSSALDMFSSAIPDPCYYCGMSPQFPLAQIYSREVGQESIPLEYVDQTPDHYLKQWPMQTTFNDPDDLPELYKMASDFFVSDPDTTTSTTGTTTGTTTAPSTPSTSGVLPLTMSISFALVVTIVSVAFGL